MDARYFRIATIGRIYPEDIDELLDAVRDVMKQPAAAFDRETAPPVPAVRVAHV
jgi:aspartate aminotransferase-like enzyme